VWVGGCVGVWVCGCVGVWVCGCALCGERHVTAVVMGNGRWLLESSTRVCVGVWVCGCVGS